METRNYSEDVTKSFERLGVHINTGRERFESGEVNERELVRESLKSFSKEVASTPSTTKPQTVVPQQDPLHVIPEYAEIESDATKQEIERIVELSANKGIEEGIRESLKHSAFIQDAIHDALIDKLVPELKRRGILK